MKLFMKENGMVIHNILREYRMVSLDARERLLPYHLPVLRVGMLPRKKQWVSERNMRDYSFNLVLSGSGYLRDGDTVYTIKAPCLFFPAAFPDCTYGPNDVWEELFVVYDRSMRSELEQSGYLHDHCIYAKPNISRMSRIIDSLTGHLNNITQPGVVDHIDSVCENMLREAILPHGNGAQDDVYRKMIEIRESLRRNFGEDPNIAALARECGMSRSTFRRNWERCCGIPPKQYVISVRIEHASSLLIEGGLKIKEVAYAAGFSDPLYFSKVFRKIVGMTPTEFMAQYS